MNKHYIAPQIEVANIGTQSIICASATPTPTPTPMGDFEIVNQDTQKQW